MSAKASDVWERLVEDCTFFTSSPSRNRLLVVLESIPLSIWWNTRIPWTDTHVFAIRNYVSGVGAINPNFCAESPAYSCLRKLSNPRFVWNIEAVATMFAHFMQELQELFQVPRLQQRYSFNKSELVAVFITFLVELLDHKTEFIVLFEDPISYVKKELNFLLGTLGDTPFQGTNDCELEGMKKLLAEFEVVANEAGNLVRSFIFTTRKLFEVRRAGKALSVLLEHIWLLKASIVEFSNSLPKTCVVESNFIVDSVLHDLEDLMNREDDQIVNVKDQLKVLHEGLTLSQSLLKEIKLPQHSQVDGLKELAIRTRDVAYEVKYLISTFLVRDASLWYLTIRLPHVIHKIELIGTGLQKIKKNYEIGALQVAKDLDAQLSLQPKRSPDADEIIVGFEEEATNILDTLVGGTEHLQIISIIGMPGLGKTTLAQKLYKHPLVNYHFHKCSWCVVSQIYERKNLLIKILMDLRSELNKEMDEESLAEHMYKSLKGRRYLIVMDDIWDPSVWDDFGRYFPDDGNGSRILFTSRNKDVAPPNSIIHMLSSLSNDQCWELLEKKVFRKSSCPPQLLGIGMEIAANCKGLPLAVVVVAGILSTMDKEVSTWRSLKHSLASRILSDQNNATEQILQLSYQHLPEHLKPCFLYFGVFPEDTRIPVKRLKWLWIAEGFIRKEEHKRIDSIAEEYLMELINKSLVVIAKRRSDGGAKACVVHDLLHDLCLRIAQEQNFLKVAGAFSIYEKHHRLCLRENSYPEASVRGNSHLSWQRPFGFHVRSMFGFHLRISLYTQKMKLLRVMDSPQQHLNYALFHMRYLVVSSMRRHLLRRFVNLEFLIVTNENIRLSDVRRLIKLRYLSACQVIIDERCNTAQSNNLEFLSIVTINTRKDEEMMKCSPHLRKLKCICRAFVDEQGACRYPDLCFLTQLESLHMNTYAGAGMAEIRFPSTIKKLTLSCLCLPWEKMSIIGELPNLQVLKLEYNAFVGETWETKDGQFQQLIFLKLGNSDVAQWNVASSEHFPKLQ